MRFLTSLASYNKGSLINLLIYISIILFVSLYSWETNSISYINLESVSESGTPVSEKYNPGLDKNNPDNMLLYVHDNKYYISSYNEDDPNNPYRRSELIYQIKSYVDHIQGIKRYRDIAQGWIWDERQRWYIEARSPDSEAIDAYLQDIWDNVDTYTTRQLINTLKDLKRLWSRL